MVCHAPSQLVNEKSPFYFLDGKSKAYATRESTLLEVYIKDKATLQNSGGVADNTAIDISAAHIEIGNDPVDFSVRLSCVQTS